MPYPIHRLRRFRRTKALRNLFAENTLSPQQLVQPILIGDSPHHQEAVNGSLIIKKQSVDFALKQIDQLLALGIQTIFLQAFPDEKDTEATAAWAEEGLMQQSIQTIKKEYEDACTIISETTLRYASRHGEEGIVLGGKVLNDPTTEMISRVAVAQAEAGADFVCPTDMMDGRTLFVRDSLDDSGFDEVGILANSVKFASVLHNGLEKPDEGYDIDLASYQVPVANQRQSLREVEQDMEEGADALLFSPADLSVDTVSVIKDHVNFPIAIYQTASEAAMIESAGDSGWFDGKTAAFEKLLTYKNAGADIIISFYAKQVGELLK